MTCRKRRALMFLNRLAAVTAAAFFLSGCSAARPRTAADQRRKMARRHPLRRPEEAPGWHLRDHRAMDPVLPDAHGHKEPEHPRDQTLGPEVQGLDEIALSVASRAA